MTMLSPSATFHAELREQLGGVGRALSFQRGVLWLARGLAVGSVAVQEAGRGLAVARLDEVAIEEAFSRAVRALVVVGNYFVVLARQRARVDPAEFEQHIGGVLFTLLERGQALREIRPDLPVALLVETLIGVIVSVLAAAPAVGVEDKVDAITSLFLNGAHAGST